jgi:hypothetical protein
MNWRRSAIALVAVYVLVLQTTLVALAAGLSAQPSAGLDEVGTEIRDLVVSLGQGGRTKSEELGHQEFILTYKSFEPLGPACLPA